MKRIFPHPLPALLMLTAALMLAAFTAPLLRQQNVTAQQYPLASQLHLQRVLTFEACGHQQYRTISGEPYLNYDSLALQAAGWQVDAAAATASLHSRQQGLCPACQQMRHLRLHHGQLCVFSGPAAAFTASAQPLLVLEFSPAQLPVDWQLQLQLRQGAIEFATEEALFSALDSLDEYR